MASQPWILQYLTDHTSFIVNNEKMSGKNYQTTNSPKTFSHNSEHVIRKQSINNLH